MVDNGSFAFHPRASGLGLAVVEELLQHGANVVVSIKPLDASMRLFPS